MRNLREPSFLPSFLRPARRSPLHRIRRSGRVMPVPAGESEERLRGWLEEMATDKWDHLVAFVLGATPVNDRSVAKDVIQDAIVKIMAKEVRIPDDSERAWNALLSTIRNVARNHHRSERVRKADPLARIDATPEKESADKDLGWRICFRLELGDELRRALECLTRAKHEVVQLRYMEEYTIEEVAELRGCSERTVKNLASRALADLRVALDGRLGQE